MRPSGPSCSVDEHRPDDFLGRQVELPEIHAIPLQGLLEQPLDSVQAMIAFARATACLGEGVIAPLAKPHWGVWQARHLEAAWWRLQDAYALEPALPHGWGATVRKSLGSDLGHWVRVDMERYSPTSRAWLRDMTLTLGAEGGRPGGEGTAQWPCLPVDQQVLGLPGVAERLAFWEPVSAYRVGQALHAFRTVRLGIRSFRVPLLAHAQADPVPAFTATFGLAAGAAMAQWRLERALPKEDPGRPGAPRL